MPAENKIEDVIDNLGRAFEEFKKTNDQRIKEIETKGTASADTVEKLGRIEKDLNQLGELKERLAKAEVKLDRPRNPEAVNDDGEDAIEYEHRKAFLEWVRFGKTNPDVTDNLKRTQQKLSLSIRAKHADFLAKASGAAQVDTLTGADGGYGVPKVISDIIAKKVIDISPFRQYAKVVTVGTTDYHELVDKRGETGGWVGETGSRTGTQTPALIDCKPPIGTLYAYPKTTEEAMQDIFFDVQGWIIDNVVNTFAQMEGIAFATGDGTNKPLGFLNATSAIVDGWGVSPQRADFSVQYLPTGVAGAFPQDRLGSPKGNPADVLYNTIYAMKPAYRMGATWAMSKATIDVVRKWKDGFGNYLWAPGLAADQPSMLMGYDIIEAEAMPAIGANTYPVAFANFRQCYLIVDRAGVRMTVDEVTTPGYVKFYVRRRVGGKVLNSDAIKVIKAAVS